MPVHDYIVVGSGCSGAIAAQTLVEAGANVTMLDVGVQNDSAVKIPAGDFITLRKTDPLQYRYFIGDNAKGVSWGKIGTGAQITPTRRFIMNLVNHLTPLQSSTFLSFESLAYGGMGSGWSLQSWEYSKADLSAAGLDCSKMKQSYDYLASTIGVSASNNDATRPVTGSFKNYQPAAKMDRNNAYMYAKYLARKKRFNKQGITLGQTPLALLTKNLGRRQKYASTGMGFYSDNGNSAWRPGITVDQLKKRSNFSYVGNCLVISFVEKTGFTEVHCLQVDTGKLVVFRCRTLVLGTGALASARIVLRSFQDTRAKLPFLSNAYTYVPCLQPNMLGKAAETNKLNFAQLSLFLDKAKLGEKASMASLHSYQSLMLFRIVTQVPFNFVDARILMRYLSPGVIIMGVYHPDAPSKDKYVRLVPDAKSPTGDTLNVEYALSDEEAKEFKRREKIFMKAMRKMGAYPLKRINPGFGTAIHYGGTLPFSDTEKPYTLSRAGRLHGTKRVYVADSSGFTYLPSQGLTFSIMANARVIAQEALYGNQ